MSGNRNLPRWKLAGGWLDAVSGMLPRGRISPGRVAATGRRIAQAGLDLLFPPICAFCDADLPEAVEGPFLCESCRKLLAPKLNPACPQCGLRGPGLPTNSAIAGGSPVIEDEEARMPRAKAAVDVDRCAACVGNSPRFDRLISLGDYAAALREAVLTMKRGRGEPLAWAIAELFWQLRGQDLSGVEADLVIPVPMHWLRRAVRGTNSPDLIAGQLGRKLGVPVRRLLRRRRFTRSQGSLSPSRRLQNVRGAFRLAGWTDLAGKRLLLVDDVVTSMATCNEAARLLKRAGVACVAVAAVCRTQPPA